MRKKTKTKKNRKCQRMKTFASMEVLLEIFFYEKLKTFTSGNCFSIIQVQIIVQVFFFYFKARLRVLKDRVVSQNAIVHCVFTVSHVNSFTVTNVIKTM